MTSKHLTALVLGHAQLFPAAAARIAYATQIPATVWIGIHAAREQWDYTQAAEGLPEPPGPFRSRLRQQRDDAREEAKQARLRIARLEEEVSNLRLRLRILGQNA